MAEYYRNMTYRATSPLYRATSPLTHVPSHELPVARSEAGQTGDLPLPDPLLV